MMEGRIEPESQSGSQIEGSDGQYVENLGKQPHFTPKTGKKKPGKTQSTQKNGRARAGRRKKQPLSDITYSITPRESQDESDVDGRKKHASKKSGRTLFPPPSAAKERTDEASRGIGIAERAASGEKSHISGSAQETRNSALQSSCTPCHISKDQLPAKHLMNLQQTETGSSQKPGSKRRRLYSQPVGVIEPTGSVSGSQSGDNPSAALILRPKPSDTASRANESVYDLLLEHSAQKSSRTGRAGTGSKKVPCGRKSAPPRARSVSVATPAPARSSPRPPRRRAAAAAVSHLRDTTSEDGGAVSLTDNNPQPASGSPKSAEGGPEGAGSGPGSSGGLSASEVSPSASGGSRRASGDGGRASGGNPEVSGASPGAETSSQDGTPGEDLERGNADVFYLPTVVRSDDEDSDEIFEDRADPTPAQKRTERRTASDETAVERDSIWPSSDPDWEPKDTAQDSPETSETVRQERQRGTPRPQPRQSTTQQDSNESTSPVGAVKSAQKVRESDRRLSSHSFGRERELGSDGPSWLDSDRRKSRGRVTCYSRARQSPPPSPDRSLRRYSYLSGVLPESRDSGRQPRGRSRSRSGSRGRDSGPRSGAGRSGRPSPRPGRSPRLAARPFFTADPDTESPEPGTSATAASTSDSVSRHVLVVEQDPCWYRQPRRELGPNISSESSCTRRRQARSPPRHPRQRTAPWTYGRGGPDPGWADRQPPGAGFWRHTAVPVTLGSRPRGTAPGSEASEPRPGDEESAGDKAGRRESPETSSGPQMEGSEESAPAADELETSGHQESPEEVSQDAASPAGELSEPEPEPMEVAVEDEQGSTSVGEPPAPPDSQPARPVTLPASPAPHPVSVPSHPAPAWPERGQPVSRPQSVLLSPVSVRPNVQHARPSPPPPPPAHQPIPRGTQPTAPPKQPSPLRPLTAHQPIPRAPQPTAPPTQPLSPTHQPFPSSNQTTSTFPTSITLPPARQPIPHGSQPTASPAQPVTPAPQPFPSSNQTTPTPLTLPPAHRLIPRDPQPTAPPPAAQPTPTPDHHTAPESAICSELSRLVARWRQLARLEQQTFGALRSAQRRQQELMQAQGRLRCVRLEEGKRARAGVLAACGVLERLVGGA